MPAPTQADLVFYGPREVAARIEVAQVRVRVARELGLARYPEQHQDAYLIGRCLAAGIRQELPSWCLAGSGWCLASRPDRAD